MLSQIFETTHPPTSFCENWKPKGELRTKKGNFLGDFFLLPGLGSSYIWESFPPQKRFLLLFFLGGGGSQSSLTVRFTISEERIKLGLRAGGAKNTQSSAKWTPLRWIRDPESPGRGKETPTPGSPIAGKFASVAPQLSLKVAAVQSLCTIQLPVQPQSVPFYLRPANCLATLRTV